MFCVGAVAQNQRITGTVSDSDGNVVVGATVAVVGTTVATTTNGSGEFAISADRKASLEVSYVGMATQIVAVSGRTKIDVVLKTDVTQIEDVIVTATGMARAEKTLGYAATKVNAEDISSGKSSELMLGLMGKVPGVSITQTGGTGTSQKVIVRGYSSISSSNQPLYVIDGSPVNNSFSGNANLNNAIDFGSQANDINPEDVESITVLKGASATALYGSRAANGVVMIVTTKGKAGDKIKVVFDASAMAISNLRTPQYQQTFGQGWEYDFDGFAGLGGDTSYFGGWADVENGSWGPKLDGRTIFWNYGPYVMSGGTTERRTRKFSYKDLGFYETGFESNTNITVSGGSERTGLSISYGNTYSNGIIPGDNDYFKRNTFSFRGNTKFAKDIASVNYNINYVRKDIRNVMAGQGGDGSTLYGDILQRGNDVDLNEVKDYTNIYNNADNYYTPFSMNPYWIVDNNYAKYQDDRVYGNIELNVNMAKGLKAIGRIGGDFTNSREKYCNNVWSPASDSFAVAMGASPEIGSYSESSNSWNQIDASALLNYNGQFGDYSVNAVAGWNLNQRSSSSIGGSFQGLIIPGWFSFENNNSISPISSSTSRRRLVGLLAQADLGYKDFAYLTFSARNDWSSTLPINDNSFFYWGINGSIILTDAIPSLKNDALNFLKVRAAYGTTGNDAATYLTSIPYYFMASASSGFATVTFPINNSAGYSKSTRIPANTLKPELSKELEFGVDARFFDNRVRVDISWYNRNTTNQIMSLGVASETGYGSKIANVGKINNKGIELALGLTPVKTKDVTWDITYTFSKNKSEVKELYGDTKEINIYGFSSTPSLYLAVGQPVGIFKFNTPATVEEGEYKGYVICNNYGIPTYTTTQQIVGKSAPDFIMGMTNRITYKNWSVAFTLDWHKGGVMNSQTKYIMYFTGNAPETAYNNRNPFIVPNSVLASTDSSGNTVYRENNVPVNMAYGGFHQYWYSNYNLLMAKNYMIDKSYMKLRDLNITYSCPKQWFKDKLIAGLDISFVGRNLLMWTAANNTFVDPDVSNYGNDFTSEWGEYFAAPSTRTIGGSIKITF